MTAATATQPPKAMIWALNVRLGQWGATLEIESSATLADLHHAILRAVEFGGGHLWMFYVARARGSPDQIRYDPQYGADLTPLDEIFPLPEKKRLFYLFDFGDCWTFSVSRTRASPKAPEKGVTYPRMIAMLGKRPIQYG